ncbi:MAG: CRISPR-associated endonuclease Cas2 [Caldisericaceae bacterium]|nr:CRISPR-associated endonuclease Cas2 [Caldisericaceae bacterium]
MKLLEVEKKFVIVAYDIVSNKRRRRVMKCLKGMGFHVQRSVFECLLTDDQIRRLKKLLLKEVNAEEDTIRIYVLPEDLKDEVRILGTGEVLEDRPFVVI